VLSGLANVVLVIGVEVQNTVKAVYGADYLAEAGHYATERKSGDAYFFPGRFSERAGAYFTKFGKEKNRDAMAQWYAQEIENARTCPQAQEHHNTTVNLKELALTPPNPGAFVENFNVYDCSKVSDGAAAILCASEEGLKELEIPLYKVAKLVGMGQVEADLTKPPEDLTRLTTSEHAAKEAFAMSGLTPKDIGVLEIHDCFTITALLMLEAAGFARYGEGGECIMSGITKRRGELPTNTTGGLIGYGHPTGATGVRQMVDLWKQLTDQAGASQVSLHAPYGMMINMGGNDRTVVSLIVEKCRL
jgi:acetyl-CoA C-acetyltransferase/acetyl-CoA acyltransferase